MTAQEASAIEAMARAALAALRTHIDALRAQAWRDGAKAMRKAAAEVAAWAHMVPPDGGSANEDEVAVASEAERRILAMPLPGAPEREPTQGCGK